MIMTIKEHDAFREKCQKMGSQKWLNSSDAYVVSFWYKVNGIWKRGQETFIGGRGEHHLVERRWREIHSKEINERSIRLLTIAYQ